MDSVSLSQTISVALAQGEFNSQLSIVNIARQLVARAEAEKPDTAVNFREPALLRANTEKGRLLDFKARTADQLSALTKAKSGIEFIEKHLATLKTNLQSITSSSTSEERAAAAAEFNELYGKINAQADGANQTINYIPTNLIGSGSLPEFTTDDLYAKVSPNGGSIRVEGQFLGTDFVVEDSSGFLWHEDENRGVYVQYASDGTGLPTGNEISTEGLTISSFDPDSGAVTFGGSGSLTGTVNRAGLGVLKSEFYNDFASDADVTQAIADIDAALATVASGGSFIKAQATLVEGRANSVTTSLSNLESEIDDLIDKQLDENQAEIAAADLKLRLALNNINLISQNNQGLVENMVIASQGLAAAPGVFGTLGY